MILVKYQEMAKELRNFRFLKKQHVTVHDSGQTYYQYMGSLYSRETAAQSMIPLSLFLQLAHEQFPSGVDKVACYTLQGRDLRKYIKEAIDELRSNNPSDNA